jgi:hypothetical protein
MEPKFRSLSKTSKALNEKILQSKSAVRFLFAAGFQEESDQYRLSGFDKDRLDHAVTAIERFIESMGAKVEDPNKFDPYKAGISSTTGMKPVQILAQGA